MEVSWWTANTHIQENGNEHQPGIERDQRRIFHETILIDKALLHDPQEVIVETGVDEAD